MRTCRDEAVPRNPAREAWLEEHQLLFPDLILRDAVAYLALRYAPEKDWDDGKALHILRNAYREVSVEMIRAAAFTAKVLKRIGQQNGL